MADDVCCGALRGGGPGARPPREPGPPPAAAAIDGNAVLALRLVSVMGVDLQMALGVRSIGEQMYRTGQLDEGERDCLRSVDRAAFTELLQESAARELDESELRAAVAYFESDAGKKDLWIAEYRRS